MNDKNVFFRIIRLVFCFGILHCGSETDSPTPQIIFDENTILYKQQAENSICFQIVNPPTDIKQEDVTAKFVQNSESINLTPIVDTVDTTKYCSHISDTQLLPFQLGKGTLFIQIQQNQFQFQLNIASRQLLFGYQTVPVKVPDNITMAKEVGISSDGNIVAVYQQTQGTPPVEKLTTNCYKKTDSNLQIDNTCLYEKDKRPIDGTLFLTDFQNDQFLFGYSSRFSKDFLTLGLFSIQRNNENRSLILDLYSQGGAKVTKSPPSNVNALLLLPSIMDNRFLVIVDTTGILHLLSFNYIDWPGTVLTHKPQAPIDAVLIEQADINGDHKPDIIVFDQKNKEVIGIRVFLGDVNSTFIYHEALSNHLSQVVKGFPVSAFTFGDVDKDGLIDLIFATGQPTFSKIRFAINQGDQSFRLDPYQTEVGGQGNIAAIAFGQTKGSTNKIPDLVILTKEAPFLSVYSVLSAQ